MAIQLIVGLGNPGAEYEQTRHNAGFWLLDNLAHNTRLTREARFNALCAKIRISGNEVWLLEPQTFMNRSGQSVGALARFYKIAPEQILVIHDELDLPPGVAKIKKGRLIWWSQRLERYYCCPGDTRLLASATWYRPSPQSWSTTGGSRLCAASTT